MHGLLGQASELGNLLVGVSLASFDHGHEAKQDVGQLLVQMGTALPRVLGTRHPIKTGAPRVSSDLGKFPSSFHVTRPHVTIHPHSITSASINKTTNQSVKGSSSMTRQVDHFVDKRRGDSFLGFMSVRSHDATAVEVNGSALERLHHQCLVVKSQIVYVNV